MHVTVVVVVGQRLVQVTEKNVTTIYCEHFYLINQHRSEYLSSWDWAGRTSFNYLIRTQSQYCWSNEKETFLLFATSAAVVSMRLFFIGEKHTLSSDELLFLDTFSGFGPECIVWGRLKFRGEVIGGTLEPLWECLIWRDSDWGDKIGILIEP